MCANVVFVAKCNSIDSRIASTSFPLVNSSTGNEVNSIVLANAFVRGEIVVSPASTEAGSMDIVFYGSEVGIFEKAHHIVHNQYSPVPLGSYHCSDTHRSKMEVELPVDQLRSLAITSNTSIVVNGSNILTFQGLSITTKLSSILCSDFKIQGDELHIETTSGDITIEGLTIDASNTQVAESPAQVYSALGIVSLDGVILSQCDLQVETGASSLTLSSIHG
ncbi:unnamed protein product [Phytophthora fragariaefolia]|uniref:Unnamed protein product n=1 Tax=Phytophthora fragariaefolia TaxID=1490495 RepID=A0A9W7CTG8_9STRA|nr:unnamed protein product [Phytophthora fragariaefolia]